MKVLINTLATLLFTILASTLFCQVEVGEDQKIGLGIQNLSNTKVYLNNNEWDYALRVFNTTDTGINSKYGLTTYTWNQGTGVKYGVHNTVRQNATSTKSSYGMYNIINPYGTAAAKGYGVYNVIRLGDGGKFGTFNNITQTSTLATAHSYGVYNYILTHNANTYGNYTRILRRTNSRVGYGNYTWIQGNTVSNNFKNYVNYTRLDHEGYVDNYGDYIYVNSKGLDAQGENGVSYGTYIDVKGAGDTERIGIYSNINGGDGYAGKFIGDVFIDGVITYSSDESLKENIKPIREALDIVLSLNPKKYNYKQLEGHGNDSSKLRYGFLAGEIGKVLPELVSKVKNNHVQEYEEATPPAEKNEVDESAKDGEIVEAQNLEISTPGAPKSRNLEDFEAVNYIDLIAILTQAIKEQQEEIKELKQNHEKRISDLEKQIERLSKGIQINKNK